MLTEIKEGLFNYLKGFTREDPSIANTIASDSWKEIAKRELERRRYKLVEGLEERELHAIANGEVDLNEIIRRAADSHK